MLVEAESVDGLTLRQSCCECILAALGTSVFTSWLATQNCSTVLIMMSQALPALCWMTFTFLVSDCSHAQLLEARECQASAETAVRHQPKRCKASAEHVLSCFSRIRTPKWSPR